MIVNSTLMTQTYQKEPVKMPDMTNHQKEVIRRLSYKIGAPTNANFKDPAMTVEQKC